MNNDDAAMQDLYRKIDREKAIIKAANQMRQASNNASVNSRAESKILQARRHIVYFEQSLNDLQAKRMGDGVSNMSLQGNGGPPPPPQHDSSAGAQPPRGMNNQVGFDAAQADYGAPGAGGYSMGGGHGMMPPRAPYVPGPQDRTSKPKAQYSKLGE